MSRTVYTDAEMIADRLERIEGVLTRIAEALEKASPEPDDDDGRDMDPEVAAIAASAAAAVREGAIGPLGGAVGVAIGAGLGRGLSALKTEE